MQYCPEKQTKKERERSFHAFYLNKYFIGAKTFSYLSLSYNLVTKHCRISNYSRFLNPTTRTIFYLIQRKAKEKFSSYIPLTSPLLDLVTPLQAYALKIHNTLKQTHIILFFETTKTSKEFEHKEKGHEMLQNYMMISGTVIRLLYPRCQTGSLPEE